MVQQSLPSPFDSAPTPIVITSNGDDADYTSEHAEASIEGAARPIVGPQARGVATHDYHPLLTTVILAQDGRWAELRCLYCGGNSSDNRGFFKGIQGLQLHMTKRHRMSHEASNSDSKEAFIKLCKIRTISDEEVLSVEARGAIRDKNGQSPIKFVRFVKVDDEAHDTLALPKSVRMELEATGTTSLAQDDIPFEIGKAGAATSPHSPLVLKIPPTSCPAAAAAAAASAPTAPTAPTTLVATVPTAVMHSTPRPEGASSSARDFHCRRTTGSSAQKRIPLLTSRTASLSPLSFDYEDDYGSDYTDSSQPTHNIGSRSRPRRATGRREARERTVEVIDMRSSVRADESS